MQNQITNIKLANNIMNKKMTPMVQKLVPFHKLYPYATENLKDCFDNFDFKDKDVLTILSSGDQLIEMYLKGAKTIDTIDLNPLTEEYTYLKLATILSIPRDLFLSKFNHYNLSILPIKSESKFNQKEIFTNMEEVLNHSTTFWNSILNKSQNKLSNLFYFDQVRYRKIAEILSYLNEENYINLQEKIPDLNFSFINETICNLPNILTKKYDFIYLSNILEYTELMFKAHPLEKTRELIEETAKFLNPNGKIVLYIYGIDQNSIKKPIWMKEYREQVFNYEEYSYNYFKEMYDICWSLNTQEHDGCLVYTKK